MPRRKQTVQKQKRRKTYLPGEMAGDTAHVKPKGVFKLFSNYGVFAAIGIVAIGAGFLFSVLLGGGSTPTSGSNDVRGEGVIRTTPVAGETSETSNTSASSNIKQYSAPPAMSIDTNKTYTATIKTEKGDIVVQLDPKAAPQAVNNFVFLAKDGYYDGSTFFRVVADNEGTLHFAQAGDPTGTGAGGPGYDLPYEATEATFSAGTLAMAKPDGAGTSNSGSQFYFTLTDEPTLAGKNTAFGTITEGLDVLASLEPRDTQTMQDPPPGVRIESIEITEA
jgi:cyclophilin family peptidyl-prolyl cis-trans isomerase